MFILCLLTIALVVALEKPKGGLPWWQGLISRRNAVVIRNLYRTFAKKLENVPVVGWVWYTFAAILTWVRFLKGPGKSVKIHDFLEIALFLVAGFGFLNLASDVQASIPNLSNDLAQIEVVKLYLSSVIWPTMGFFLCVRGRLSRSVFHILAGLAMLSIPWINYMNIEAFIPVALEQNWFILYLILMTTIPIYLLSLVPMRSDT